MSQVYGKYYIYTYEVYSTDVDMKTGKNLKGWAAKVMSKRNATDSGYSVTHYSTGLKSTLALAIADAKAWIDQQTIPTPTPTPTPTPEPTPGPSPNPWDGGDSDWQWGGSETGGDASLAAGPGVNLWGQTSDGGFISPTTTTFSYLWATDANSWFSQVWTPPSAQWMTVQSWQAWDQQEWKGGYWTSTSESKPTGLWGIISRLVDWFTSPSG